MEALLGKDQRYSGHQNQASRVVPTRLWNTPLDFPTACKRILILVREIACSVLCGRVVTFLGITRFSLPQVFLEFNFSVVMEDSPRLFSPDIFSHLHCCGDFSPTLGGPSSLPTWVDPPAQGHGYRASRSPVSGKICGSSFFFFFLKWQIPYLLLLIVCYVNDIIYTHMYWSILSMLLLFFIINCHCYEVLAYTS